MTSIQWTEQTWNPIEERTGKVEIVPEALELPLTCKKPTTYLVNLMSDLFHASVADEQLDQIFAVMALTPHHTYLMVTERVEEKTERVEEKTEPRITKVKVNEIAITKRSDIAITNRSKKMLEYCDGLTSKNGGFRFAAAIARAGCGMDTQRERYYSLIKSLREDGGSCLPLPNVLLRVTVKLKNGKRSRGSQWLD